jgi:hypothetical protein
MRKHGLQFGALLPEPVHPPLLHSAAVATIPPPLFPESGGGDGGIRCLASLVGLHTQPTHLRFRLHARCSLRGCLAVALEIVGIQRASMLLWMNPATRACHMEVVGDQRACRHSLKNRTGDRTDEAFGSDFYRSDHWFTGLMSVFKI